MLSALRQCKQIVIPLAVRVSAKVVTVRSVDDSYFGAPAALIGMERVRTRLYRVDHLLPCPVPAGSTEVGNSLMWVVAGLLVDTRHSHVWHWRPRR